jgi:hypothetical protein
MTRQDSSGRDDATTIHLRIDVTAAIVQHWHTTPGSDDTAQTDEMRAEPRTRQQHAATNAADASGKTE